MGTNYRRKLSTQTLTEYQCVPYIQLQGYFQCENNWIDNEREIFDLWTLGNQDQKFQEEIEKKWFSYQEKFVSTQAPRVVVGVHVRFYQAHDGFHFLNRSYYEACIVHMKKKLNSCSSTQPVLWMVVSEDLVKAQNLLSFDQKDQVVWVSHTNELMNFSLIQMRSLHFGEFNFFVVGQLFK